MSNKSDLVERFIDYFNMNQFNSFSDNKNFGVIITPWGGTSVPYFSLTISILMNMKGTGTVLIIDDLNQGNEVKDIKKVIEECGFKNDIYYFSDFMDSNSSYPNVSNHIKWYSREKSIRMRRSTVDINSISGRFDTAKYRSELSKNWKAVHTCLSCIGVKSLLYPGGIFGNSSLYSIYCEEEGIRGITYDCGTGRIFFGDRSIASHIRDARKSFDEYIKNDKDNEIDEYIISEARKMYSLRRDGKDKHKYQNTGTSEKKVKYSNDMVLFPLGIDWDSHGLGRKNLFHDPFHWLTQTVKYILKNTNATVVVREHPYARFLPDDNYEEKLCKLFKKNDNFVFISKNDKINTYDLIEESKVILPYVSTTGVEAAMMGKTVIALPDATYSGLDFVSSAFSIEEYYQMIVSNLQKPIIPCEKSISKANIYYYFFHKSRMDTYFTPQPDDVEKWIKCSINELIDDKYISFFINSNISGIPMGHQVLNYEIEEISKKNY